jgi:hypothetical protein
LSLVDSLTVPACVTSIRATLAHLIGTGEGEVEQMSSPPEGRAVIPIIEPMAEVPA